MQIRLRISRMVVFVVDRRCTHEFSMEGTCACRPSERIPRLCIFHATKLCTAAEPRKELHWYLTARSKRLNLPDASDENNRCFSIWLIMSDKSELLSPRSAKSERWTRSSKRLAIFWNSWLIPAKRSAKVGSWILFAYRCLSITRERYNKYRMTVIYSISLTSSQILSLNIHFPSRSSRLLSVSMKLLPSARCCSSAIKFSFTYRKKRTRRLSLLCVFIHHLLTNSRGDFPASKLRRSSFACWLFIKFWCSLFCAGSLFVVPCCWWMVPFRVSQQ